MRVAFALLLISLWSAQAVADQFAIETDPYYNQPPHNWTGKLIQFEPDTGVMTFEWQNRGAPDRIEVHYTRVYSFSAQGSNINNKPFPPTRAILTDPLPTKLKLRHQYVELKNDGFVGDDIPQEVRVRGGDILTMRGEIVSHDGQDVTLNVLGKNGDEIEFSVPAIHLNGWIRGRRN